MLITWIDKKSVLYFNKRKFKAGDSIPAGVLTQNRIDMLLADKKISVKVIDTKDVESVKTEVKPVKTKFKSKAELEDEELQKLIDEEARVIKKTPIEPDLMSGMMGGKGPRE